MARFGKLRGRAGRSVKLLLKALALLLVVAVCFVPAVFINNPMGYIPGFVVAFGILFSGLYLLLLRRGLEFAEATRVNECVRGEAVDFVLRLRNTTPLLYPRVEVVFHQTDLFGGEDKVSSADIILLPKASRDFTFSMSFEHIGRYQAGLQKVVIHDLLGLFKITFPNTARQQVDVLPRVVDLHDMSFSSEVPTSSTAALKTVLNEGMDYCTVRDYVWGDPIKAIHWKISSRFEDNYVTRIYETCANPSLTTVIDLHAPTCEPTVLMQLYDAVLESALSVDSFARRQGLDSTMAYADETGRVKRFNARLGDASLVKIAGMLKLDSSVYAGGAYDVLREELNAPAAASNVALCTSALDEQLIKLLQTMKNRRRNPIVFYAIPSGLADAERTELLAPLRQLDVAAIPYVAFSNVEELLGKGGAR